MGLSATPVAYSAFQNGWLSMGIGASLSIPGAKPSILLETEVGLPRDFGFGLTLMFGTRTLFTLDGIYYADPNPGSDYAIPIKLRAGVLDLNLDGPIRLGAGLGCGIKAFVLALMDDPDSAVHWTIDAGAFLYSDFRSVWVEPEAYTSMQFSLNEGLWM